MDYIQWHDELSSLRVADADREQLIDELREHALAGRLTSDELEERVGGAYGATTRGELDALRADLPVSSRSVKLALVKRKGQLRRRLRRRQAARWGSPRSAWASGCSPATAITASSGRRG